MPGTRHDGTPIRFGLEGVAEERAAEERAAVRGVAMETVEKVVTWCVDHNRRNPFRERTGILYRRGP